MKLIGFEIFSGEKNGKQYSFKVVYFLDPSPRDTLKGSRCVSATLVGQADKVSLEIGKDYTFCTYRNNGRLMCNAIF